MLPITGGSCLSKLLKVNCSLQELYLRDNNIGDEGISLIADGLKYNNTLTKLYVGKCGFSVEGTLVYIITKQI